MPNDTTLVEISEIFAVPAKYENASLDQVFPGSPQAIREDIVPRLRSFIANGCKGPGLSIFGSGMTGKTYMMSAMLNEAKKAGVRVAKLPAWNHFEEEREDAMIEYCSRVPVLLMDAIDTTTKYDMTKNSFLSMVASLRIKSGLPIFTTSWKSPAQCLENIQTGERDDDEVGNLAVLFRTIAEANDAIHVQGDSFFVLKEIADSRFVSVPRYAGDISASCGPE